MYETLNVTTNGRNSRARLCVASLAGGFLRGTSVGEATTSGGSRLSLTSSRKGVQLSSHRKIALVTGVFFIITIIPAPIAAFILYAPVLNDPDYVVGAGADKSVLLGRSSR